MCVRDIFIESDFKETGGRRFLNSSAIPSIFSWLNEEETHHLKKRKLSNVRKFPSATTLTRTSDEENVTLSDSEDESGPTTSTAMEVDETFTASHTSVFSNTKVASNISPDCLNPSIKPFLFCWELVE